MKGGEEIPASHMCDPSATNSAIICSSPRRNSYTVTLLSIQKNKLTILNMPAMLQVLFIMGCASLAMGAALDGTAKKPVIRRATKTAKTALKKPVQVFP